MIEREFYPLTMLAKRWACTVNDLLHLGIQDRAQVCVNIYGIARGTRRTRMETEAPEAAPEDEPLTDDERREAEAHDAAFERWKNRTTKDMPHGLFELGSDDCRLLDMPGSGELELHSALKFDGGWWECEFDPPVYVRFGHLCMLQDEVMRLDREVFSADMRASAPAPATRREKATTLHDNNIIAALKSRGIDPLKMPSAPLGNKPWQLREEIAKQLGITPIAAKKAFTRLRKAQRMKHA